MTKLAIAWLAVFSSVAAAQSAPTELDLALGGYERAPTAASVKRLGPEADRLLVAVANDERAPRVRRTRALIALRFAPSAFARDFLHDLLRRRDAAREGADVLDAAAALASLAPYGRAEAPLVMGYLAHASADVRQAAAATLGLLGEPTAAPALQSRLAVERDPGVRLVLTRSLHALER